ncbi:MAG: hypothetical protein ACKO9H_05415, partial [Planctomycetota bacterium]
ALNKQLTGHSTAVRTPPGLKEESLRDLPRYRQPPRRRSILKHALNRTTTRWMASVYPWREDPADEERTGG